MASPLGLWQCRAMLEGSGVGVGSQRCLHDLLELCEGVLYTPLPSPERRQYIEQCQVYFTLFT